MVTAYMMSQMFILIGRNNGTEQKTPKKIYVVIKVEHYGQKIKLTNDIIPININTFRRRRCRYYQCQIVLFCRLRL